MNPFDQAFPEPAADVLPPASELAAGAGRRVLLVDDDPMIADVLRRMLEARFDVDCVHSGEAALELLSAGREYAVVVSDQQMPGIDGVALLARFEAEAPLTTRMMLTGVHDAAVAARALAEGHVFRLMHKPLQGTELLEALEDGVLRHRRKVTRQLNEDRLRFAHDSVRSFNRILEQRLHEAQYAIVLSLAKLAEERDHCTGLHLERVSALCRTLAEGCRERGHFTDEIDQDFIEDIELCAPLHDIGKVGIPDSILLKPGKLTPEEWDVMRTHPEIGAQTLEAIIVSSPGMRFLKMGRDVALGHHEFWNGDGYPQGLYGEATPLAARILKVADCYDALTSERPYKHAWTHDEAMAHILARAGTEFDPSICWVMSEMGDELNAIRVQLADGASSLAA